MPLNVLTLDSDIKQSNILFLAFLWFIYVVAVYNKI